MSTTGMLSSPRRGSAALLNQQVRRPSARTPDEVDFDLEKMDENDIRVMNSYSVKNDAKSPVRPERAGPSGGL